MSKLISSLMNHFISKFTVLILCVAMLVSLKPISAYAIDLNSSKIIGLKKIETAGCNDPEALNFDPIADDCNGVVDGSDISCCVYAPINDLCINAIELVLDEEPTTGSNELASDENDAIEADVIDSSCWGLDGADGDVWFKFTGNGSYIDILTEGLDTQIAVYEGCSGELLDCDDDSGVSFASLIDGFCAESGTEYLIEVEGFDGAEGFFDIRIVSSDYNPGPVCCDPNYLDFNAWSAITECSICDQDACGEFLDTYPPDEFMNPIVMSSAALGECELIYGDNFWGTDSPESLGSDLDMWYLLFTTTECNVMTVTSENLDLDVVLQLYDVNLNLITIMDQSGTGSPEIIMESLEIGETYYLNVAGWNQDTGTFEICWESLTIEEGIVAGCYAVGCTDALACNYIPDLEYDDGSCAYAGDSCNDFNNQTTDDVYSESCECTGSLLGCTDTLACNYLEMAEVDDGSCLGIGDLCDDGDSSTLNDLYSSSCECAGNNDTVGCLDQLAINYSGTATVDNGSCIYMNDISINLIQGIGECGDVYGSILEGSYLYNQSLWYDFTAVSSSFYFTADDGCNSFSVQLFDSQFSPLTVDISQNSPVSVTTENLMEGEVYYISITASEPVIYSCGVIGCISDGLPEPMPGDYDGNGVLTTSDLTQLLGEFGSFSESTGDLNQDGAITAADLMIFMSLFG